MSEARETTFMRGKSRWHGNVPFYIEAGILAIFVAIACGILVSLVMAGNSATQAATRSTAATELMSSVAEAYRGTDTAVAFEEAVLSLNSVSAVDHIQSVDAHGYTLDTDLGWMVMVVDGEHAAKALGGLVGANGSPAPGVHAVGIYLLDPSVSDADQALSVILDAKAFATYVDTGHYLCFATSRGDA